MVRITAVGFTTVCFAAAVALAGTKMGWAQEKPSLSALTGTYMQNVLCKGDGSDSAALKVTISPQQIVSNIGVCAVLDTKLKGKSILVHVECKFPAGPLVGDITFTPRSDNTVKFVDRDNTYNAVLHRCPE